MYGMSCMIPVLCNDKKSIYKRVVKGLASIWRKATMLSKKPRLMNCMISIKGDTNCQRGAAGSWQNRHESAWAAAGSLSLLSFSSIPYNHHHG